MMSMCVLQNFNDNGTTQCIAQNRRNYFDYVVLSQCLNSCSFSIPHNFIQYYILLFTGRNSIAHTIRYQNIFRKTKQKQNRWAQVFGLFVSFLPLKILNYKFIIKWWWAFDWISLNFNFSFNLVLLREMGTKWERKIWIWTQRAFQ